ncbi:MAG: DUF4867 family protein [Clostridia bacterium]|nr:DUF4867 family protein [Clostridia bacterium]
MKLYSIQDEEFKEYGRALDMDCSALADILKTKPCPDGGTVYVPEDKDLQACPAKGIIQRELYGGLPIQIGYCNGHNQKLNCLEWHTSSEINIPDSDIILLLARRQDMEDGKLDTAKVKAFLVPAGKAVEVYATTLHYAPCGVQGSGFRVIVVLPQGTNLARPEGAEDPMLWAANKWLLAHKDTNEAKAGAYAGLTGENIQV